VCCLSQRGSGVNWNTWRSLAQQGNIWNKTTRMLLTLPSRQFSEWYWNWVKDMLATLVAADWKKNPRRHSTGSLAAGIKNAIKSGNVLVYKNKLRCGIARFFLRKQRQEQMFWTTKLHSLLFKDCDIVRGWLTRSRLLKLCSATPFYAVRVLKLCFWLNLAGSSSSFSMHMKRRSKYLFAIFRHIFLTIILYITLHMLDSIVPPGK